MKLWLAGAVAALTTVLAQPATAEWRRAESEHFIVYSDGREGVLRDYVRKLEIFDAVLRTEVAAGNAPGRKLPIFLVPGENALREAHPYLPRYAAGVYVPSSEDIFAVAIRTEADDYVLHEYVHHLMFQNFAGAYPAWLVEGFAEYYAASEFRRDQVLVGGFLPGRVRILGRGAWISVRELLTTPFRETRGSDRDSYYPVAWLLTHWFLGNQDRRAQLQAYLTAVASGTPSIDAMQTATGLTPEQIERQLRSYFNGSVPQTLHPIRNPDPQMTITVLPPSADDLLLINQRLRIPTPDNQRPAVVADVRRRAARHPDDPLALLAVGHAELHMGDPEAGAAVLERLLELQPDHVEALQLMATRYMRLATERPAERQHLLGRGRSYLARAYAADPENYYTLILLGQSREGAPGYPNENDLATWFQAFERAPQLPVARLGLARALMQANEGEAAATLLPALANAPHGGPASDAAKVLLARALAGEPPLSEAEINAAAERQAEQGPDAPPEGEGEAPPETPPSTPPA